MRANAGRTPKKAGKARFPMTGALLPAIAALATAAPLSAADYSWPVVRVVDGDTVKVDASADLPPELASLSVRLRGVDTPEKGRGAKCDAEERAGRAATAFTEYAIEKAGSIVVRNPAWGKWGGRVVADLVLDGSSLSSALLEAGHARRYDGSKRDGWCPAKPRDK